ncbi:MAG TPA: hypothetical protein VGR42_18140 [Casimicrobiaceae bacterium]|jgi:4-aminobutyrate aminotransferase-like enzyme|nr:hypothetical protein [Casimicrobiaceae bacterium]
MSVKDDGQVNFRQNLIRYGGDLYPEIVDKAQGCYVWDSTGKKVLDFTSGQMYAARRSHHQRRGRRSVPEPHHELGSLTTQRCMELGLSMNIRRPERGSVWRIAPPLTVTTADVDLAMTIFDQALSETRDVLVKRPAAARTPAQRAA